METQSTALLGIGPKSGFIGPVMLARHQPYAILKDDRQTVFARLGNMTLVQRVNVRRAFMSCRSSVYTTVLDHEAPGITVSLRVGVEMSADEFRSDVARIVGQSAEIVEYRDTP